jgi:hypothetical protein
VEPTRLNANHCARLPGGLSGGPAGIARELPERGGDLILAPDPGRDAMSALPAKMVLADTHERQTDATAPVLGSTASLYMFPRHPFHAAISAPY